MYLISKYDNQNGADYEQCYRYFKTLETESEDIIQSTVKFFFFVQCKSPELVKFVIAKRVIIYLIYDLMYV